MSKQKHKNFKVSKTPVEKVIIEISRRQLWNNFVSGWADLAWDDSGIGMPILHEVKLVLLSGEPLSKNSLELQKLFKNGWTFLLLGSEAMKEFDNGKDILHEIVVTDDGDDSIIIRHEYIEF